MNVPRCYQRLRGIQFGANITHIKLEKSYVQWIKRYVAFHHKRHSREMGQVEIEAFLTHIAVEGKVAASTQNQAFNAILFLYRDVLNQTLDFDIQAVRAKQSTHRNAKGMKDRFTMLPERLIPDLQTHLQQAKTLHQQDLNQGFGSVWLQQFQIQNDFAPFQRSVEILRIINPSCCKGFRTVKF